jgi:hypothetical protein
MPRSNLSITGLDFGRASKNLTYYYGLSDFWSSIFEDSDKIDLLLEATSQELSDIYSRFLQLTATLSIADMEVATSQQLKLVLISEDDAVNGQLNTYTLSTPLLSSRLIVNRPFLPTAYYENEIHYRLSDDGTQIQFFTGLSLMGFPSRTLSTGSKQYAIWFVDTVIDESALYDYYGKLIDISPQASTDAYKSFIYGLYYLYSNGPNLALLRKGLNLALGIPLARETETVLEIRKYLETDQWLVITDSNSYLIPFGLTPSVAVGDVLNATDELAQWIEVKDWIHDGDWWINLALPPQIMPYVPAGQPDRYAKAGSYADYLMRNFLKKHTFLVNVKTIDFKNLQNFEQLSSIINEVKPSWTYPIYIWTVPLVDENFNMNDDLLTLRWDQFKCDNITVPMGKMQRLNAIYPGMASTKPISMLQSDDTLVSLRQVTYRNVRADQSIPVEMYWEVVIDKLAVGGEIAIGVAQTGQNMYTPIGSSATSWVYLNSGSKRTNNATAGYGASFIAGDIIGVQYNPSTGTLTFYKNGVSQGNAYTTVSGTVYPVIGLFGGDGAYYFSPGIAGNYLSTPDATANRITGDIDIRTRVYCEDWAGGTVQNIIAKEDGTLRWQFAVTATGALSFNTQTLTATSSVVTGYAKRTANWVRVTRASASGDVIFYTSTDGITWSTLGTTQATAAGALVGTAGAKVYCGWRPIANSQPLFGRIHYLELQNGIAGTVVARVEPCQLERGGVLMIGSDTGETWTITRNPVYLSVPGSVSNYASTPDSLKSSVIGDIDIRCDIALTNWNPGSVQTLVSKWLTTGNQRSYMFNVNATGKLEFSMTNNGTTVLTVASDAATGFGAASRNWVRVTRTLSSGDVIFYTSSDGITWTPFGTTKNISAGIQIFDSTSATQISGINQTGGSQWFTGKLYYAEVLGNGVSSVRFAPNEDSNVNNTSLVSTVSGEIWIITQTGAPSPVAFLTNDAAQGKFHVLYSTVTASLRSGARFNFGNYPFIYSVPTTSTPGVYTVGTGLTRGCPQFTRETVSHYVNGQLGNSSQINAKPLAFEAGVVQGYVDSTRQLRRNSSREIGWLRAVFDRSAESNRKPRSFMMFQRGENPVDNTGTGVRQFIQPDITQRVIHLYNTTQADITEKFTGIGGQVPGLNLWTFTLFQPFRTQSAVDVTPVDQEYIAYNFFPVLQATFNTFFFPNPIYKYLGNFMPAMSYRSFAPTLADIRTNDYLLFIRIQENTLAVYWVTSNNDIVAPSVQMMESTDQFLASGELATLKRGLSFYSSYYLLRGAGATLTYGTGGATDAAATDAAEVDGSVGTTTTSLTRSYSDEENPTPITIDRHGVVLKFRRDFK